MLAAAGAAQADPLVRDLGGGWQVTIFDSDLVDVVTDYVDDDILVLEKAAEFTEIDPETMQPAPINLVFQQILPDAQTTPRIILTNEIILNHTGQDWTSFKEILIDAGQVMFNQGLSATFSISPFTTRTYNGLSTEVTFAGGVVPDGSLWVPGLESGGLVIEVDLSAQGPVTFTLKELPIPEPASAVLLCAGALALRRFRRA
jgi:hypothetical protein